MKGIIHTAIGAALCVGSLVQAQETELIDWQEACCQTERTLPLGMSRFRLEQGPVTGWKLNGRWYFGAAKAPESTLPQARRRNFGLVRQGESARITLGTGGVELRVRF